MAEQERHDPVLWVLLPKDEDDYKYDLEQLAAFTTPEAAREERDPENEHEPKLYVPADRLHAAMTFLDNFTSSRVFDRQMQSDLAALRALLSTVE